ILAKSKLVPVRGGPDLEKAERQFDVILHLIGQVVVAWGKMDDALIYVLARLSGSRPKAAGITYYALDALSTRLAVIKGLAQHKLKAGKKANRLAKAVRPAWQTRKNEKRYHPRGLSTLLRSKAGQMDD